MARYAEDDWYDDDEYDPDAPCTFCGDQDCDKSGYNCPDDDYQEYNLRGWDDAQHAFYEAAAAAKGEAG